MSNFEQYKVPEGQIGNRVEQELRSLIEELKRDKLHLTRRLSSVENKLGMYKSGDNFYPDYKANEVTNVTNTYVTEGGDGLGAPVIFLVLTDFTEDPNNAGDMLYNLSPSDLGKYIMVDVSADELDAYDYFFILPRPSPAKSWVHINFSAYIIDEYLNVYDGIDQYNSHTPALYMISDYDLPYSSALFVYSAEIERWVAVTTDQYNLF